MNHNPILRSSFCLMIFLSAQVFGQDDRMYQFRSAVLQVPETIEIPATAKGPLKEISVSMGDRIEAGQLLATVDDKDAQLQLKESKIELEMMMAQAQSDVDVKFATKSKAVAVADLRRARESNQRYAGVVSDREMDRLKLLVEQSAAELEKIQFDKSIQKMQVELAVAAVEKNEIQWSRHQIRSSINGKIVEITKHEGEWVNVSDPILKVIRLDVLRIEHSLPSKFATSDLTAATAEFSPEDGDEVFMGKVVYVDPEINPLNLTVKVWFEFPNSEWKLRPGMKGRVVVEKNRLGESGEATESTVASGRKTVSQGN